MFTNAEAMALFNKATSLARKFEVFGDIPPGEVLSAINTASAAITDSDMSTATKNQLIAELNNYTASVNSASGNPEVSSSQDPAVTTPDPAPTTTTATTTVDDGSDPYVSNGVSTIEPVTQQYIDDGSDPYVSNSVSTITPIDQPIVDDGSDPYVSNGVSTITPIDDGGFDPFVSNGTSTIPQGLTAQQLDTNSQATQQDVANFQQKEDWRVRLSLAPGANYLYKVPKGSAGILEPLQATDGVIFPYTPQIQVNYQANYDPTDLTHSNYKIYQYRNSGVDAVTITCDFTAQDTYEANYLLAVIHFFRSVTKMFYGQDQNPKPGTPPPLCYLSGLGAFQFDSHPIAITSFNYSLPADVDYIRAGAVTAGAGVNRAPSNVPNNSSGGWLSQLRAAASGAPVGGKQPAPVFTTPPGTVDPTYVPTKIQMSIGAVPIVTRNDISNTFSLEKYATGSLLRGSKRQGGGIW